MCASPTTQLSSNMKPHTSANFYIITVHFCARTKCAIRSQLIAYKRSDFFLARSVKIWKPDILTSNFKKWLYTVFHDRPNRTIGPFNRLWHFLFLEVGGVGRARHFSNGTFVNRLELAFYQKESSGVLLFSSSVMLNPRAITNFSKEILKKIVPHDFFEKVPPFQSLQSTIQKVIKNVKELLS